MPRRRLLISLLATAAVAVVALGANAATPTAGHIGPAKRSLSYETSFQFGSVFGLAGVEGVACPPASEDPTDSVCDHFALTVDVAPSYWRTHHGGVDVTVPSSFFGYAYTPDGRLAAASGWTGEDHVMRIPEPSGAYEIRLAPYVAFGPSTAKVKFVSAAGAAKRLTGDGFVAYKGKVISSQPKARPANAPIRYTGPRLSFRSTYVGRGAAEPTLGVDKKGAAFFVAGAFDALPKQSPKQVARTVILRSTNGNRSWSSIQPPITNGVPGDGHPATQDPYVFVDPQYGRVFNIDLTLAGSYLSFTDDRGKTWTRGAAISAFGANDHQTLFTAPAPLGLPTLDPAFPKAVYYCVNQINGSHCARSLDGGRTFQNTGTPVFPPADAEKDPEDVPFCGGLHGHGVGDAQGRIFIPRGFCGEPQIGISEDGGTTWSRVSLVRDGVTIGSAGIQTSVAVDPAGNLYYTWWDDKYRLPYLAVSKDHGQTWSRPRMIAPPGVKEVNFPTIDVGTPGRIAVTFPGTLETDSGDISRPWFSWVVESVDALSANPTFVAVAANPGGLADPVHRGDCNSRCGRMYDFLDIVVAPNSTGTVWVTATDTCRTLGSCSTKRVAGYSGDSGEHGAADSRDGVAYMQVSGPRLVVGRRF